MQYEMVIINPEWLAACGYSRYAGMAFLVIHERFFSAYNAHFVTVQLPWTDWEVDVRRGVSVVQYVA